MFTKILDLFKKPDPPFVAEMPLIPPPGPASISSPTFAGSDDTYEFLWDQTKCSCNSSEDDKHMLSCAKWQGLLALSRARRCGY